MEVFSERKEQDILSNYYQLDINDGGTEARRYGDVIFEAVVNALVHRDYLINSSIRVFIFDNRVEIISPGKLPNTATIETIKVGIQIVRNPILVSFVPKLELPYRGLGSGIPRVFEECRSI